MAFSEDAALEALSIAAGTEASFNAFMQGLLMLILRHYVSEGVSDEALTIRAFEVIRDVARMPGEGTSDV